MADVKTNSVDRKDSTPKSSAVGTLLQLLPKLPSLSDLKIPDVSPKAIINALEQSKTYGKLITAIKSNADPEKLDNACEFAVKLSVKYGDRITASNIVTALQRVKSKIDHSFRSLSAEDRENLRIASKVISRTSNQTYSGELRMNDLEQLKFRSKGTNWI